MAKKAGANFSDRARITKLAGCGNTPEAVSDHLQIELSVVLGFWPKEAEVELEDGVEEEYEEEDDDDSGEY